MEYFLQALSYAAGEKRKITNLIESQNLTSEMIDIFQRLSLEHYREYNGDIYDIAIESALKTMGDRPRNLSKLLFATSSFHAEREFSRINNLKDINSIISSLELQAYPYGIFLSDCANFISAVKIGTSLVMADSEPVLFIVSDVVGDSESRIVPPGLAIKSDAAASGIITFDREQDSFRILEIAQFHDCQMIEKGKNLNENYSKGFINCVEFVKDRFLDGRKIDFIVLNNNSVSYIKSFSKLWNIDINNFYTKQIKHFAHCFSSDIVINLVEMKNDELLRNGMKILAVSTSPTSISAMYMEYVC